MFGSVEMGPTLRHPVVNWIAIAWVSRQSGNHYSDPRPVWKLKYFEFMFYKYTEYTDTTVHVTAV